MNNKGQVLVIFVVLLPFVLILFGYIIDKCYLLYEENSQKNIGNMVCKYAIKEGNDSKVRQLALENDNKYNDIKIKRKDKEITITLKKEITSLFGQVLGISSYTIKTNSVCKN